MFNYPSWVSDDHLKTVVKIQKWIQTYSNCQIGMSNIADVLVYVDIVAINL